MKKAMFKVRTEIVKDGNVTFTVRLKYIFIF